MTNCSTLLSVNVINSTTKSNSRKKDLFGLPLQVHNLSPRDIRPGAQAGTEAETMAECYLLACSLWPAQLAFLYSLGPTI